MTHYLTNSEITKMAEAVLATLEVTPLSHARKCEIARETAWDDFGKRPRKSAVLLAVKLANLGWDGIVAYSKKQLAA